MISLADVSELRYLIECSLQRHLVLLGKHTYSNDAATIYVIFETSLLRIIQYYQER